MYKGLFDFNNGFYHIDIKDFSQSKKVYTGEFESNIFCYECDNVRLGKLETYAHRILYIEKPNKSRNIKVQDQINQHGVVSTYVKGIDYKKFKLFLLSILWRSSISSRDFYEQVNLGPHEEIIRKMLLSEDPGSHKEYPCFITTYLNSRKELPKDLITNPIRVKNNNGTRYKFLIGGLMYNFFVSQNSIPDWILESCINRNNELRIPHMPEKIGKEMLNSFFGIETFK